MFALALCIVGLGTLICLVSGIWSIVVAFQRHIFWGLAVLFIPLANLVFLFVAWAEAKKPFLIGVVGMFIGLIGVFAIPAENRNSLLAMGTRGGPVEFDMAAMNAGSGEPEALSQEAVQGKLALLRSREADLTTRKAGVNQKDPAAVALLDAEIKQYNDELQPLLKQVK